MEKLTISITIFLLCLSSHSFAQVPFFADDNTPSEIKAVSRISEDVVKLRWAPTTPEAWRALNEVGFNVDRYTLMVGTEVLDYSSRRKGTRLNDAPLKPSANEKAWQLISRGNDFAPVAAQAIYGESFTPQMGDEFNPETIQNIAQEEQNRFGFTLFAADHSFELASFIGLGIIDNDITPGERYLYKIYPADSTQIFIDTAFAYVDDQSAYPLPKIIDVQADFADKKVSVSWDKEIFSQFYVSFNIEKSRDGLDWELLNDLPFITTDRSITEQTYAHYVDTLEFNNLPYFYRISGRSIFDEQGPPSDAVQGMGKSPLPNFSPFISGVLELNTGELTIEWEFDKEDEAQIIGFHVARSQNADGPFEQISTQIIEANKRLYVDENPVAAAYYVVSAIDMYNRPLESFSALAQLYDEDPPAIPENVRGKIMEDGKMVITWDKNTTDDDFFGNRVWLSNNPYGEYSQITVGPTEKGYHIDSVSLNTLSEIVFIKLTAEDLRGNVSDFSPYAEVMRPDTIAPVAPHFKEYEASNEWIEIGWANSPSGDVSTLEIKKRVKGSTTWVTLKTFNYPEDAGVRFFRDTSGAVKNRFEYMLRVTDDVGLIADSKILELKKIPKAVRNGIEKIESSVDRRDKYINLDWDYSFDEDLIAFRIYRAIDNKPLVIIDALKADDALIKEAKKNQSAQFRFKDESLKMNTTYHYQVKAIFKNGAQSPRSEVIVVDY